MSGIVRRCYQEINAAYLWGGEEESFEFSKNIHLFTSKLNLDRSSYFSVYIVSHNLSRQQTLYWSTFNVQKLN